MLQFEEENPVLKDLIENLKTTNADLTERVENLESQNREETELRKIAEKRAEIENLSYIRQKEISEEWRKLAEANKPKTNWALIGWFISVIAAIAVGAAL